MRLLVQQVETSIFGAVNVDPGMHSHAGAWERGNRPAVVCVCIPTRERGNEERSPPSFPQNSPSFPRRRESITERPILNELARRGLYAFPRGSVGTREKSPDWRGYNLGMSLLFLLFPQISHPWQPGRP